jgi:hypothetical protein
VKEGEYRSLWIVLAAGFVLLWVLVQDRLMVERIWQWWLHSWGLLP